MSFSALYAKSDQYSKDALPLAVALHRSNIQLPFIPEVKFIF